MRYEDLKIGQKIFFVSAIHDVPIEEVQITSINGNDEFTIKTNGKTVFCEIDLNSNFNFAHSIIEKDPDNYGYLYSSLELIKQEDRFYILIHDGFNDLLRLSIENKIKISDFIENLIKK